MYVKKRLGKVEPYQSWKITLALESVYNSQLKAGLLDQSYFEEISIAAKEYFESIHKEVVSVKEIEAFIEEYLMKDQQYEMAKKYILYSFEKQTELIKIVKDTEKKIENNKLNVIKSNGKKSSFDIEKIKEVFHRANKGLKTKCKFSQIEEKLKKSLIEDITTKEISKLLIDLCINEISIKNASWQLIAGRLEMMLIYKEVSKNRKIKIGQLYKPKDILTHLKSYIKKGLYSPLLLQKYSEKDILKISKKIIQSRDLNYGYTTVTMISKRYLHNINNDVRELPQEMYLFASLFLAIPEKEENRLDVALDFYNLTSTQKISLATPTLMNARTTSHQLASCFVLNADDDLRGIFHEVENIAQISKGGGGVGIYMGNIRGSRASIRGIEGINKGVLPWIKIINDTALAVDQLGQRAGAVSTTLDIWHIDIEEFLEMQLESGDIRSKSFDVFPAVSIPDIFMRKMENSEKWYTFEPHEVSKLKGWRLQDFFREEFDEKYEELIQDYKEGKLKVVEEMEAKDLFKMLMKTVVETGMPYIFFRDTADKANPNKHAGRVYSSQLCVKGDTKIQIELDGNKKEVEIKELDHLRKDNKVLVLSKNLETGEDEYKEILDYAMTSSSAEVLEIEDEKTGKKIICTPEHKIFTQNRGYIKAKDLVEKDTLLII